MIPSEEQEAYQSAEESSDIEESSDTEEQSSDTENAEETEAACVEKLLSALTPMKVCAAEGTESQLTLTGITWEIDPEESDGDTFDGSEDSSGKCYVYVPVLPGKDAEGNELLLDEDAELPMIYVLIGEHGIMLVAKPTVAQAPVIPTLERKETPYMAAEIISRSEPAVQLKDINGTVIAADKIEWKWKGSTNANATKNWSVGQHTETIVATYTGDTNNYQPVEISVTITVRKSTPQVLSVAASGNYEHGAYLREQTLQGSVLDKDGETIKAEFVWKNPNTQLSVSDSGKEYEYICIPYDTENYNRVEGTATVTVNKLEYPPNRPAEFMYVPSSCDVVSKISLPTGWQWKEDAKDIQLAVDVAKHPVMAEYVGEDKDNYEKTTVTVSVKRSYCEHTKTSDVIVNTAPTCTAEGKGCIECASGCCDIVRNNITIPKIAHNYQRREPDLGRGESELFEYYKCSGCGKEYITAAPPKAQEGSSEGSSESSGDSGSPDDTGTTAAFCY